MATDCTSCICKYKEAFYNNHTPMMIISSSNGSIINANSAASNYYGYSKEELHTKNIYDINVLIKDEIFKEMEKARAENRKFFRFKHRLANDEVRDVEVYSGPIKIENEDLLFSVIHDIKEKIELERDYIIRSTYFDSLFNNSLEAIAIVDRDFRILNINNSFQSVFQYRPNELENKDITEILCNYDLFNSSYYFRDCIIKGEFVKEETKRRRKDGTSIDVLILGLPLVVEGEVIGAYCIYTDLSKNKEKEEQIRLLTSKDILTGQYNRDFFIKSLDNKISQSAIYKGEQEKFAVLLIAINEFEKINDALGYLVADEVLKKFAARLKDTLRGKDIIARFSKSEFAIIVLGIKSIDEIELIANRIAKTTDINFLINGLELHIAISIGIAIFPDDGNDTIALVRKADIALNKSKELNINGAFKFESSLDK